MYGPLSVGTRIDASPLSVELEQAGNAFRYRRRIGSEAIDLLIAGTSTQMQLLPVEPVNLPRQITEYLELEFSPIVVAPGATIEVFLTFPVEIAALMQRDDQSYDPIDIFTLAPVKYSLYGPHEGGLITRWARSEVHLQAPSVDPLREGVLSLKIVNASPQNLLAARLVLWSREMSIWYSDAASMSAQMKLLGPTMAEVMCIDKPALAGCERSVDLYTDRRTAITKIGSFMMEYGFS